MRKPILTAIALLILGLAGCSDDDPVQPRSSQTFRVPDHFETIQQAIDAARPGDTVLVASGAYTDSVEVENILGRKWIVCIDLKSGVEVRGETGGAGDVILMGNSDHPVVNCAFVDSTTALIGFTVSGGCPGMIGWHASPNILNCIFEGNHRTLDYSAGGGMYWDFSSPILTNCIFTDNSAKVGGGAMFANESNPVLTNCLFTGNLARTAPNTPGAGGALMVGNDCRAILTNCLFTANHADSLGGAINIYDSIIEMTNCNFTANDCDGLGGAIFLSYGGKVEMTDCLVEGNHADARGGGFYFRNSRAGLNASYSRIIGNTAPEGGDGFLKDDWDPAEVTLRCCEADTNMWVGSITLDNEGCD